MVLPSPALPDVDAVRSDGGLVHIRAVTAEDRAALHALLSASSDRSIYRRFFSVNRRVADDYIDTVVRPNTHDHVALAAFVGDELVALATYERMDATSAEFAVLVADDRQHEGIGTLLLEHLAEVAREDGMTRFVGEVLAENRDMVQVLHDLDLGTQVIAEGSTLRFAIDLHPGQAATVAMAERERIADSASLRPLLDPRSIAVIGAGERPGSVGHQVLAEILAGGFTGTVYAVNPKHATVLDTPCFPTPRDLPVPVDLAVVAVPAAAVPDVLRGCGERGVRAVVLLTAGFGETGTDGRARQAEAVEIARRFGMRMVGPNCVGVVNTDPTVSLDATFADMPMRPGRFSLVSQSGAFGIAFLSAAAGAGAGIAQFVSIGNKADVSGNDLLLAWESDPRTRVIGMYLESVGDARRFVRIARRVSTHKPIIAIKSGRTSVGQRAGASHTAAAATSDVAMDAMFDAAGVLRVTTIAEMVGAARVFGEQPLPAGRRLVIIGNSGGPGILAADASVGAGLDVVDLDAEVSAALAAAVPGAASTQNPIDLGAAVTPDEVAKALTVILERSDADMVMTVFTDVAVTSAAQIADAVAAAAAHTDKTIVATQVGAVDRSLPIPGTDRSLPVFAYPEAAAVVLGLACKYVEARVRTTSAMPRGPRAERRHARALVRRAIVQGQQWLGPDEVAALLECYHVPQVAQRTVSDTEAAVRAAEELGYPLAVKISSADIVHKSDVGGVQLGIADEAELRGCLARFDAAFPAPHDVLLQTMVPQGTEVIVGAVRDPDVGPMVMVGAGGVLADVLGDRAFALAPLNVQSATTLLDRVRVRRLLGGVRGKPPADVDAVIDVLVRVSTLVQDLPEIVELDVNPVVCSPSGAVAVDARIRVAVADDADRYLTRQLRAARPSMERK